MSIAFYGDVQWLMDGCEWWLYPNKTTFSHDQITQLNQGLCVYSVGVSEPKGVGTRLGQEATFATVQAREPLTEIKATSSNSGDK